MIRMKRTIGVLYDGEDYYRIPVTVRLKTDKLGATLSLSDDEKVMLAVPLEGLEDVILPAAEADDGG